MLTPPPGVDSPRGLTGEGALRGAPQLSTCWAGRQWLKDRSLITGRGGYKTVGEGRKFYPYTKKGGGGAEQVLTMVKGGCAKSILGSFYAVSWSFGHTEKGGGRKTFPLFKKRGRGAKSLTLS